MVGAGVRDRFKIGASGKMVTASAMARSMALGADWCNSARAFMFAVGCIQSQRCHTNQCPVGVTTQDPKLQRALIVPDKSERVHNYHRNTVHALAEMIAAMGLDHTSELRPSTSYAGSASSRRWHSTRSTTSCKPGALLAGTAHAAVPGVLGPGLGRVLPPLVRRRAGSARLSGGRRGWTGLADHRVVIVGAGFGGLFAAKFLRRAPVQVTLVDRRNYHLFQPLLYQLATGILSEGEVAPPIRDVLRRHANVSVEMATVTGFDLAAAP